MAALAGKYHVAVTFHAQVIQRYNANIGVINNAQAHAISLT